MEVLHGRCAGLDIHTKTVAACVIVAGPGNQVRKEIRTFSTMTDDLLLLSDWLAANAVTHVAMEFTGSLSTTSWKAISSFYW